MTKWNLHSVTIYFMDFFKTSNVTNKLDFLDGFRGYLVLTVVFHHFFAYHRYLLDNSDYQMFEGIGAFIGVIGFFVLSAFLLTYRLLIDYDNASDKVVLLKTAQYAIRRFFRIYITFLIFWTLIHFLPNIFASMYHHYAPFWNGVFLDSLGEKNHLWTIPGEIKYYFCIPFISYAAIKCKNSPVKFSIALFLLILVIEYVNPFGRKIEDYYMYNGHILHTRLSIFMSGSLLAVIYYNLKDHKFFLSCLTSSTIQSLMTFALIILFFFQFEYTSTFFNPSVNMWDDTIKSGYLTFIIMFLMLFGAPNCVTNFFTSYILTNYGKYSFGVYLLHFVVMETCLKLNVKFATYLQLLLFTLFNCYLIGSVWFYLIENPLMKIANRVCKHIANLPYFQEGIVDKTSKYQHQNSENDSGCMSSLMLYR